MLLFTPNHEWVELDHNGTAVVGISQYAVTLYGATGRLHLCRPDDFLNRGNRLGEVHGTEPPRFTNLAERSQSGGWWHPIHVPIAGKVIEANQTLDGDNPQLVSEPEQGGWLLKLRAILPADLQGLLNPEQYANHRDTMERWRTAEPLPKAF